MPHVSSLEAAKPSLQILIVFVLLGVVLSLARAVLIPVALAILLTFILTPAVMALQRRGFSRPPSVLLVMATAMSLIGCGIYIISNQLHALATDLSSHKENVKQKLRDLQGPGGGVVDQLVQMIDEVTAASKPGAGDKFIIPVRVRDERGGMALLWSAASPLIQVVGSVGLVVALTLTMLFKKEDLRDRLLRLAGHGQLTSTTRALDEASRRISRYLTVQLAINAGFGLIFAIGLVALQVPYAILWGILAMMLRFIPYIGTWMAAVLPVFVSVAVSAGWFQPVAVIAFAVAMGIFTNNLLEPLLTSRTTGVSPVALVVAAAFWTWLWGPIGLILSTPLTVCLTVLGRYVPPLQFLDVLCGTDPALDPQYGFFQRLLARDEVEAAQVLEQYLVDHEKYDLYDKVLVPALVRAKEERNLGHLDDNDLHYIVEATQELLEDIGLSASTAAPESDALPIVIACTAKDGVDELAVRIFRAEMVECCQVRVVGTPAFASEIVKVVEEIKPAAVLIGAVHPGGLAKIRYLCKRLRGKFPQLTIAVGFWGLPLEETRLVSQLQEVGATLVSARLQDSCRQLEGALTPSLAAGKERKSLPAPG